MESSGLAYLTLVTSPKLTPLLKESLYVFEPFGLGHNDRRDGVQTLGDLLALERSGGLNRIYKSFTVKRIRAALKLIESLRNSAPMPPAHGLVSGA